MVVGGCRAVVGGWRLDERRFVSCSGRWLCLVAVVRKEEELCVREDGFGWPTRLFEK